MSAAMYECHAHALMDGADFRAARARHRNGVDEPAVRACLAALEAVGVTYVRDGGEQWLGLVQQALADCDLVYGLPERGFLYDINKVEWRWTATMYGRLEDEDGGTADD